MKLKLLFCTTLFISALGFSQYNQIGQDVFGDSLGELTGTSLSLNASGNRYAVYDTFPNGDDERGRIRVFELQGDTWTQIGQDVFGFSGDGQSFGVVEMNAEGNRYVFGSPSYDINGIEEAGLVRIFELQSGQWIQLGQDLIGVANGDFFGSTIDINALGNAIVVGATEIPRGTMPTGEGYAKAFKYEGNVWVQKGQQLDGNLVEDFFWRCSNN